MEATEQTKQDYIGKKANNSVSESGFVLFKEVIAKYGHIIFNHALAEEFSCFKKYLNQGRKVFITERRENPINHKDIVVVIIHKLAWELQDFLVTAGVEMQKVNTHILMKIY